VNRIYTLPIYAKILSTGYSIWLKYLYKTMTWIISQSNLLHHWGIRETIKFGGSNYGDIVSGWRRVGGGKVLDLAVCSCRPLSVRLQVVDWLLHSDTIGTSSLNSGEPPAANGAFGSAVSASIGRNRISRRSSALGGPSWIIWGIRM